MLLYVQNLLGQPASGGDETRSRKAIEFVQNCCHTAQGPSVFLRLGVSIKYKTDNEYL